MLDSSQDGWLISSSQTTPSPTSFIAISAPANSRMFSPSKCASPSAMRQSPRRHGRSIGDFDKLRLQTGIVITNFDNEMLGLYRSMENPSTTSPNASRPRPRLLNTIGIRLRVFEADSTAPRLAVRQRPTLTTPFAKQRQRRLRPVPANFS